MGSDEILPAALALSVNERAKLARELLESLHEDADADVAAAWVEEIEHRAREVENGVAKLVDWSTAPRSDP